MRRLSRLARWTAARFIPSLRRVAQCSSCARPVDDGVRMIAGPGVYLCADCFALAARQLAPRRPPADAVGCRFCRQGRSPTEVTRVGAVTICADCLGNIEVMLAEGADASRPGP